MYQLRQNQLACTGFNWASEPVKCKNITHESNLVKRWFSSGHFNNRTAQRPNIRLEMYLKQQHQPNVGSVMMKPTAQKKFTRCRSA
jgi:hypothetical protein